MRIIRRLQSISRKNGGLAILCLKVLVDSDGRPLIWADPLITLVEPMIGAEAELQTVVKRASTGEQKRLLRLIIEALSDGHE
jgi:hypothetical protein